ncbi:MAG: hypothetical protein ABIY50_03300 [Ignavibacteria bacterium]
MNFPSVEVLINTLHKLKYRVYNTPAKEWNLNIVGIRAKGNKPDKFDDLLTVFHCFMDKWYVSHYPITTDPSDYYLKHPINKHGTAILKEGQYKEVYKIDKHRGKYYALCQRLGNVTVYRDSNKDGKLKLDPESIETGAFTINIHKGPRNGTWETKNTIYSAGCQVFADDRHFAEFMIKVNNGSASFGNKFTYTLIREEDL